MEGKDLFKRLRNGEVVLGFNNMYPASGIIEGLASGWDFVWIDGQHGQHSYQTILHAVQTADARGLFSIIRPPGHENGILGPLADLCPAGFMIPMVDTPEQAAQIAQSLRFPPKGKRSYGGRRVIDLGGRDYYHEQELFVMAQVETLEAVENAEKIISTDGIDALFFGPDDMKTRMGLPINTPITENDKLKEAMKKTADAAKKAGKFAGCVATNAEGIRMVTDLGYQVIAGGGDILFLRTKAAEQVAELRGALEGRSAKADKSDDPTKRGGVYG